LGKRFKEIRETLKTANVPRLDAIEELITTPPSNYVAPGGDFTSIEFLPSSEGPGYRASIISGGYGAAKNGWSAEQYGHLSGVARIPTAVDGWEKVVVESLKANGVVFLSDTEVERYLSGEGRYWRWQSGISKVNHGEALIWSISKPATPTSDRAKQRRMAAELLAS